MSAEASSSSSSILGVSPATVKELRTRWDDLTSFVSATTKEKWWLTIYNNYSPRHFHNLDHLAHMLKLFDQYKDKLKDRYAMAFAIIFKHLEYDPKASDDAEKNAQKLREFCSETTFDQENYVANLIIESGSNCTDAHLSKNEFGSDDLHYLIDFDMAYLGDEPHKYGEHSQNIRREFGHLNDGEYREQRIKVLELFLQVPNIYASRDFRERFEEIARKNIQSEIDSLNKLKLSDAVDAIKEGVKHGVQAAIDILAPHK